MCRHDQFRSTLRRNLFPLESCRWWVSCSTHNRKINSAHHSPSGGVYSGRVAQTLVHNLLKKLFQACFVAWSRRDCILAQPEKKVKLKCRVYSLQGPVYTWLGVTLDMQSFIIFFFCIAHLEMPYSSINIKKSKNSFFNNIWIALSQGLRSAKLIRSPDVPFNSVGLLSKVCKTYARRKPGRRRQFEWKFNHLGA